MSSIPTGTEAYRKRNPHLFGQVAASPAPGVAQSPQAASRSEADLHDKISKHCRENGWVCFHGSMAHRAMRTIGENDFHCLLPGGIVLFVECKTKTGKLSPEQLGMKMWMEKLGHKMHVIRTLEEFVALCQLSMSGRQKTDGFTSTST